MKTIGQVKKIYSKIDWYKQGAAVKVFYIGYPWKACLGFTIRGKRIPLNFLPFSVYLCKEGLMDVYFARPRLSEVAEFYYGRERRIPGSAAKLKQRWERTEIVALEKAIKKVETTNLSALNNIELIKFFENFSKIYIDFWREPIFLDAFDVAGDLILEQAFKKEGKEIEDKNLQILTSPEELSWIQREKRELLSLANQVRRNKKWLWLVKGSKSHAIEVQLPELVKKLKAHSDKYHWIYNDYAVIRRLDWKFFLKYLQDFLNEKVYKEERRAIISVERAKKEKQRLAKKLKLSRQFMQTANFLVVLAAWRDWRKAYNQRTNGALRLFVDELRKRSGLNQKEIDCLWWWEVKKIFKLKSKDRKILRQRGHGFFTFGDPEDGLFLGKDGRELQAFMTKLLTRGEKLQGRPAYRGIVRGGVKIILSQKDFRKMKKGDILVAPNTRPEYVPMMKIAGAIISEEGGLTCHAAIVSRELKVPAVVGVQGAVAALKNGDLVEVDANNGVVKKI